MLEDSPVVIDLVGETSFVEDVLKESTSRVDTLAESW